MRLFLIAVLLAMTAPPQSLAENPFKGTDLESEYDDWGGSRCTRYAEYYGAKNKATEAFLAAEDGSRAQCDAIMLEAAAKPPMLEYFRSDPSCRGFRRVDIELETYSENLQHTLFNLYCGKFGEHNPYKPVTSAAALPSAACGTMGDDQKELSTSGIIEFLEEDEADGTPFTRVYTKECDELEIILPAGSMCEEGQKISATGMFWWCGDDGSFSDGVECLFEHALEVTRVMCNK